MQSEKIEIPTAVFLKAPFCWDVTLGRFSGSCRNFEDPKMRFNIINCKWRLISSSGFAEIGPDRYL